MSSPLNIMAGEVVTEVKGPLCWWRGGDNVWLYCLKQLLPSQYGPQLQPAPDSQLSKQHKLSNITIAFLWVISFMEWQLFLASLCRQLGRYYKWCALWQPEFAAIVSSLQISNCDIDTNSNKWRGPLVPSHLYRDNKCQVILFYDILDQWVVL